MDKMDSSGKAGNKGHLATPRDGSAVELVALLRASLPFLVQTNDEHFGIDETNNDPFVNRKNIDKDTVNSTCQWTHFQFTPNFLVAAVVVRWPISPPSLLITSLSFYAPEMFNKDHIWLPLKQTEEIRLGSFGVKTWDPRSLLSLLDDDDARLFLVIPSTSLMMTMRTIASRPAALSAASTCPSSVGGTSVPCACCVLSVDEKEKCRLMKNAFGRKNVKPDLDCVSGKNDIECMENIRQGIADIITLDPEDAFRGQRSFQLVPLAAEDYGVDMESNVMDSVAVAKRPDLPSNRCNLRGKTICSTAIDYLSAIKETYVTLSHVKKFAGALD